MRHVPAQVWSRFAQLSAAKRRAVTLHADDCPSCARARERITALPEVFAAIRDAEVPELEWDHVGARIHWSRSLERRTGQRAAVDGARIPRRRRRRRALAASFAALAALAAIAMLFVFPLGSTGSTGSTASGNGGVSPHGIDGAADLAVVPVSLSEADELDALVVMAKGSVFVDDAAPSWNDTLGTGRQLRTGDDGYVVVQFARGGGFALGPSSSLAMRSFDTRSIELVLNGTLDVRVTRRAENQQFIVIAGERTVSVRGTAFRVHHRDGDLAVACEHGRVEVADRGGVAAVNASERLVASKQAQLADGASSMQIPPREHAALAADLAMPLISAWQSAQTALDATSIVSVVAGSSAGVSVDDVRIGRGSMQLRLAAGRHQVAVEGKGPWAGGRWVELEAGDRAVRIVYAKDRTESTPRIRQVQLRLALGERRARLRRCVSRFERHGVARGSFVALKVTVNADGTVGAVSASDSNVDLEARRCLLSAVSGVTLPRGAREIVRVRWQP